MESLISQDTLVSLLQVGGQYLLPIAALLRALYYGVRGKLPEGFVQIFAASAFAGITAVVDQQQPNLQNIVLGILGNSVVTAGLLAFIVAYLLRMPNYGLMADGIIGGIVGLVGWLAWVYVLGNDLTWWTIPLLIIGGAVAFTLLRTLLRQIARLFKIATYFVVAGLLFALGAGGFLLLSTVLQTPR